MRHSVIIVLMGAALLVLSGCGYKGPPTYEPKAVPQEQNVAL